MVATPYLWLRKESVCCFLLYAVISYYITCCLVVNLLVISFGTLAVNWMVYWWNNLREGFIMVFFIIICV